MDGVVRVVRERVTLSEILKWQRFLKVIYQFLKVIYRFLKVIYRFLKVIYWFLEVILTRGRYRAARAAKKYFFALDNFSSNPRVTFEYLLVCMCMFLSYSSYRIRHL